MKELSPEERRVMKEGGTEAPFSGEYIDNHEAGIYRCTQCGNVLFNSDAKFDSGTGWPSFTDPAVVDLPAGKAGNVGAFGSADLSTFSPSLVGTRLDPDGSRTEVYCKNCDGHLGHVFDDLPRFAGKAGGPVDKGGKRYCINSVCLEFEKEKAK